MTAILVRVGSLALGIARDTGGMTLVMGRTLRRMVPPRIDRDELLRSFVAFGEQSLPIVAATAAFTGMIMVLQAAVYVEKFAVYGLVGWFAGYSTFREIGPVLIALMFSGRVGANNTSELGTMRVTEQLDALRILAIDVYQALIVPRTISMVVGLTALVIFADLVAVISGAFSARVLMDVEYSVYFQSLFDGLGPSDLLLGVGKAAAFGFVIAVVSSYFGMAASGGSTGVGRAVNAQVVACAVAVFLVDYAITVVGT